MAGNSLPTRRFLGRSVAARHGCRGHRLRDSRDGTPVQSWTTATWPDGSIKWSAHAIGPSEHPESSYELVTGDADDAEPSRSR